MIPARDKELYYRLTALWVVCEAFAGGIMHSVKLPFSGMMVSALAVFCITLIAWFVPQKGAILKATIVVAVFKLMLSPYTPPTAYIAVFFQGLMGQLLLRRKNVFLLRCILFAFLALVESGIQRLLVLVILYGQGFWSSLDQYIQKVTGAKSITSYSTWIAALYVTVHAVMGILVGIAAAKLVRNAGKWVHEGDSLLIDLHNGDAIAPQPKPARKKIKVLFIICWLLLMAMLLQSIFFPGQSVLPKSDALQIIIRALLLLLSWHLLLSPLIMKGLKWMLSKQKENKREQVNAVNAILPAMLELFRSGWKLSSERNGLGRFKLFFQIILVNILR